MQNDRLLASGALLFVIAAHIGAFILSLYLHVNMPKLDISSDSLSYVDLSGMSMAGSSGGPVPEAAPAAAPEPVQTPAPKPQPKETPKVKPVVRPDAPRNDVATAPKEKVKPETKTEPKPPTQQQEVPPRSATGGGNSGNHTAQGTDGGGGGQSGSGAANQGSGRGSGSGTQDGGNGGGAVVPATHLGSHLNNPRPPYPEMSRELGEEGTVGLRVAVTADGRAQSVTVVKRSGYPRLDRAAKAAVEKYRFQPATRGGMPIPYKYTFSISFSLDN